MRGRVALAALLDDRAQDVPLLERAEGRNLCPDSVPVPAQEAEALLLGGLRHYVGDLDAFLLEQTAEGRQTQQDRERRLRELSDQLAKLDRTRTSCWPTTARRSTRAARPPTSCWSRRRPRR